MINILVTFLYVALALILGLVFFYMVAMILIHGEAESEYQKEESRISMDQIGRSNIKIDILQSIGRPQQINGDYSPTQKKMWARYNELDAADQAALKKERALLARLDMRRGG